MRTRSDNIFYGLIALALLGIFISTIHMILAMAEVSWVSKTSQWWDMAIVFVPVMLAITHMVYEDWKISGRVSVTRKNWND